MFHDYRAEVKKLRVLIKKYKPVSPLSHNDWEEFYEKLHEFQQRIRTTYSEEALIDIQIKAGYQTQLGSYKVLEGIGAIDIGIASLVKELNDMGFQTVDCCSGILGEHHLPNRKQTLTCGYISFINNDIEKKEMLERAAELCDFNVFYKESPRRKQIIIHIERSTDWQMKKSWKKFRKTIAKVYEYL
ncbi:hypothetical protein CN918_32345 [Priestia megaterium]|nr:hypothetical protein CN918_32345 [Priestia megaterium]